MQSRLQLIIVLFLASLFLTACATNGPTGSTAATTSKGSGKRMTGAPAEMLIYEAAEQAAEDSYAEIVPDAEAKEEGSVGGEEQAGSQTATPTPE